MLNHIVIMGRLTADPTIRHTGNDVAVANFSVACDRDYKPSDGSDRETDFLDCVAWRGTADFLQKYFHKGSMIVVSGRLQVSSWTDSDGNRRRNTEIVADNIYFGESKRSSDLAHDSAVAAAQPAYYAPLSPPEYPPVSQEELDQLPLPKGW